jgi:hypothetical protein
MNVTARGLARSARSLAAEAEFRARVVELGGTVLEPMWLGNSSRHRIRCAVGHESSPYPSAVRNGGGICRTCANCDPASAERAFRARVAELGGTVLEPMWLGRHKPHHVRCAVGHESAPRPGDLSRGGGLCRVCSRCDPASAERAFRARVAEMGGTVLEPMWLGRHKPHRVRCAVGHECMSLASSVLNGRGFCRVCAGNDPSTAERAFRARVAEMGGTVLEPVWRGALMPHRVRCASQHECDPTPHDIQKGSGLCRKCAGSVWDVFYVVEDVRAGQVKFGITSGDPTPRLGDHRTAGYRSVIRLLTDLPGDTARAIERHVLSTLKLAGERPIHGREYFGSHVLTTVLDIVDHYPISVRKDQP